LTTLGGLFVHLEIKETFNNKPLHSTPMV